MPGMGRLLTSNQAARYVGISRPGLYKLIEAREITAYRILTHWRFKKEDLDDYLDRVRSPSKHEAPKKGQRASRRKIR